MLEIVPVQALADNYIWILRNGAQAAVVDPGDAAPVLAFLAQHQLALTAILLTHHHPDHIGGVDALLAHASVPVYAPRDARIAQATVRVGEGERFEIPSLGLAFGVLEVPAHTRSHIAFYTDEMVFSGDTLFASGCGRLFEGTPAQMHAALEKLMALPDATRVYCGHEYTLANIKFAKTVEPGNAALATLEERCLAQRAAGEATLPSTVGQEKATNPFVRVRSEEVIAAAARHAGQPLTAPAEVLGSLRSWKDHF